MVGIVASYLGADVVITDRRSALDLTIQNVHKNTCESTKIKVAELEWGQGVSRFDPPFDFIIGADIVYIEETFSLLVRTIEELSDDKTVILLSCRLRYKRDEDFFEMLRGKFIVTKLHFDETVNIYIFKAQKKEIYT